MQQVHCSRKKSNIVLESKQFRTIVQKLEIKYEQVQRKFTSSVNVSSVINYSVTEIQKYFYINSMNESHLSFPNTNLN